MFSNIGGKIKATAKVFCWILIVLFVIVGITLMVSGAALEGLITMIAGALSAWVGSFVLYGFGELVENSCIQTNLMIKNNAKKHNEPVSKHEKKRQEDASTYLPEL